MDFAKIDKAEKKASKELKILEVFANTELSKKAENYLKEQKYLESINFEIVLRSNFLKDYPIGYVLSTNSNNIVGFMGTIFSSRNYSDENYIYCNIHTWIVDKTYRINSFLLLTSLIKKNITLTAFTPVKTLIGLLQKFGFEKTKINYRIILLFNFLKFFKTNTFKIKNEDSYILNKLNQKDLKIYNDYKNLSFERFLIVDEKDESKYIFIIAKKVKKKFINTLNLFYVSDTNKLKNNWNKINLKISKKFNTFFCGQYFFDEKNSAIPNKRLISKSITKNTCIKKINSNIQLDTLYSDLIK